jgi:hypothetical protein
MPITPIVPTEKRFQKDKRNFPGARSIAPQDSRWFARSDAPRSGQRAAVNSAIATATAATTAIPTASATIVVAISIAVSTAAAEASAGVIVLLPRRRTVLRRSGTDLRRLSRFKRSLRRRGRDWLGAES